MMHQTGIIKIAQFDGAIEFYSRPTPVPMVTKWLFLKLNRKFAVARLCNKYGPESCTKHFLRLTAFCKHLSQ